VREFTGTWLNSNMPTHEAMAHQRPYDVVDVTSADGSHTRRVGLVAVLSDNPDLYKHFAPPGAFGGAEIECPWATLRRLQAQLEAPGAHGERCDMHSRER
jgi:hypothetical protein